MAAIRSKGEDRYRSSTSTSQAIGFDVSTKRFFFLLSDDVFATGKKLENRVLRSDDVLA